MRIKKVQVLIDKLRGKNRTYNVEHIQEVAEFVETQETFKLVPTYHSVDEIISNVKVIKLHIGCGTVYKDGWINIDNNSDNNIEKLDFIWDLRNPVPFDDNSVDFIYNEHFLEHLTVEEGLEALKTFKRILKPNGVLRIAMPDLEETIRDYLNLNWKIEKADIFKKFGLDFIQTKAEKINMAFRWWGHQWLYDYEELERRLKEAGFETIKQEVLGHSEFSELINLESRNESKLIAEAIK